MIELRLTILQRRYFTLKIYIGCITISIKKRRGGDIFKIIMKYITSIFYLFKSIIILMKILFDLLGPVLSNGGHGGAIAERRGGFLKKHHRIAVA